MAKFYKIKKPEITKEMERNAEKKWLSRKESKTEEIENFVQKAMVPKYLSWEEFRYKEPAPAGLTLEELWHLVKLFRSFEEEKSPVKHEKGKYFKWLKLKQYERLLHEVDLHTGGELFSFLPEEEKRDKQKFISRGIIEEAIASSQLEGASTSRKLAKKMIREGRKPQNASEQMILNNYKVMVVIEENYKNREMSRDLLMELHKMITKDTADDEGKEPAIRRAEEEVYVTDKISGIIYHRAPDIKFVFAEFDDLVKFANDELTEEFIHPLIKAIMIHFWIGYLHPFTDGNGRLARLMFYWYLLKNGYWAFAYLPISRVIKKSPMQYAMAYVNSEQDDYDMTYFIDYHLRKVIQAVDDFKKYLKKQMAENYIMDRAARTKFDFNDRQIQLLKYFYGDKEERTSMSIHMNVFQVTKKTAINDLRDLVKKGFLTADKRGRNVYYYPTEKIKLLFK